jgi:hypothetical protein
MCNGTIAEQGWYLEDSRHLCQTRSMVMPKVKGMARIRILRSTGNVKSHASEE